MSKFDKVAISIVLEIQWNVFLCRKLSLVHIISPTRQEVDFLVLLTELTDYSGLQLSGYKYPSVCQGVPSSPPAPLSRPVSQSDQGHFIDTSAANQRAVCGKWAVPLGLQQLP